jgi:hypothetical protein
MQKISVYTWHGCSHILHGEIQCQQQIAHIARIVALEVLHVERSVQRPEILLYVVNFSESAIAAGNNARGLDFGFIVMPGYAGRGDYRDVPFLALGSGQVVSPLKVHNVAQLAFLPLGSH